ncbi:hypothetical protein CW304_30195 [Bacillus sp. UFRGS-B20]|nr:hypothetical protein CW304_30195 [Bacillus sp. UFRGS-B20]
MAFETLFKLKDGNKVHFFFDNTPWSDKKVNRDRDEGQTRIAYDHFLEGSLKNNWLPILALFSLPVKKKLAMRARAFLKHQKLIINFYSSANLLQV